MNRSIRAAATAMAIVTLSACAGGPSNPFSSAAHPDRAASSAQPEAHLYVSEHSYTPGSSPHVFRFPIVNGIASSVQDGTLNPRVPGGDKALEPYVVDIAVDGDGNLYVATAGQTKGMIREQIDVYPPGATGDAVPSRILNLTSDESADRIAVDAQNYLYLAQDGIVSIYWPGARGLASVIKTGISAYSVDVVNRPNLSQLYVSDGNSYDLEVYDHPRTTPTLSRKICFVRAYTNQIAVDQVSHKLYMAQFVPRSPGLDRLRPSAVFNNHARIAVFPDTYGACPSPPVGPRRSIVVGSWKWWGVLGVVLYQDSIFTGDSSGKVYQIPSASRGIATPISTIVMPIKGGYASHIAVGP